MIHPRRSSIDIASVVTLIIGSTVDAIACPVFGADETQTLSVQMSSGVHAEVNIEFYKGRPDEEGSGACLANAIVQLSGFPTSRVAARPTQLAAALREIADEWGVKECTIMVAYENDTGDDLAQHELCVIGSFGYDKGDYWSTSSERNCWEPS